MTLIQKPKAHEADAYFWQYIDLVEGNDLLGELEQIHRQTQALLSEIPESSGAFSYAPGKWTIKDIICHLADTERVMNYRALRFARNDKTLLPAFDHEAYVPAGNTQGRSLSSLAEEFRMIRNSTIALFRNLESACLQNIGTANEKQISVRALGYLNAGHELHHIKVIRERYLNG